MSGRADETVAFAEMAWKRFDDSVKDLNEKEVDWRIAPEANNIRWILTHISWEWNLRVQQVLKADPSYQPKDWPEDYIGNTTYSLEKITSDISRAREAGLKGLSSLKSVDLDADIPLWGTTKKRGFGVSNYISELNHHTGQIAFIRGCITRRRSKEPEFLK